MKRFVQGVVAATAFVTAAIAPAFAESVTLTLTRTGLTNVTDAAGLWQYEVGTAARGSSAIGQYEIERRVSTGAIEAQNTAAERLTLFLAASASGAPQNIIMEGAHSFTTAAFVGSVSAASTRYAFLRGSDAAASVSGVTTSLTISWTGNYAYAIP